MIALLFLEICHVSVEELHGFRYLIPNIFELIQFYVSLICRDRKMVEQFIQ